jgi:hypothetical protein
MIPINRLACRFENLVYVRTLKCASSFYYNNLTQSYAWQPLDYDDIDWQQHHVFSHIMDPVTRNIKAKLEYLIMNSHTDLLKLPDFRYFFRDVAVLDEHSMSYQDYYGDHCDEIDWIPLGDPPESQRHFASIFSEFEEQRRRRQEQREFFTQSVVLTQRLIQHYAPQHPGFHHWRFDHARPASDQMLTDYQLLLQDHLARDDSNSLVTSYLSHDIELYQSVLEKFNPDGVAWPDTSWLKSPKGENSTISLSCSIQKQENLLHSHDH